MYRSTPSGQHTPDPSVDAQFRRVVRDLQAVAAERDRQLEELTLARQDTLLRLALAAESRDGDTGVHIVRLGQIAGLLARAITGDEAYGVLLCQAAPMHDVGKIGVPDSVLKKPGALDDAEWQLMREHPAIGARILGGSSHPLFMLAAEVALHHHERFDGGGYPTGLHGHAIPLAARIVAVADVYDALTMDRIYRKRVPPADVVRMITAQSNKHFDPDIVAVFVANLSRIEELRECVNARFAHRSLEQAGVTAFMPMF